METVGSRDFTWNLQRNFLFSVGACTPSASFFCFPCSFLSVFLFVGRQSIFAGLYFKLIIQRERFYSGASMAATALCSNLAALTLSRQLRNSKVLVFRPNKLFLKRAFATKVRASSTSVIERKQPVWLSSLHNHILFFIISVGTNIYHAVLTTV